MRRFAIVAGVVLWGALGLTAGPASASLDAACPAALPDPGFPDVAPTNVHRQAIGCVAWWEITSGTGFGTYDPSGQVRRDQMATFVARLVERLDGDLPRYATNTYEDVRYDNPHAGNIARLAQVGLVQGTGATTYSPGATVTRAQMATFLVRAYEYVNDRALPAGGGAFGDDDGNPHEPSIDKAAAAGFAAGVRPGSFDPAGPVYRDQMATFMARVLDRATVAGETSLPVETVTLGGEGDQLTEPFRLRSGTYAVNYDFRRPCFYGSFLKAEVEANLDLVGPSGTGPLTGSSTVQDVEAAAYRLDLITGPSPGCGWQVTIQRT